ncbi:MAG: N-acetyltransferase [Thermoleophilia bacterium]|nr:N-acetyltransferase [Thermoleophilia bacterium]
MALVPDDFEVPRLFETPSFVLEPLGPEHNERDHDAWSSSIDHIHATPGFAGRRWPHPMSLAENLADLERHLAEFDARTAFAFSVLDPQTDDVIGCAYVNPDEARDGGVTVRSWVRVTHSNLDEPLRTAVVDWLERDWPFASISAARE